MHHYSVIMILFVFHCLVIGTFLIFLYCIDRSSLDRLQLDQIGIGQLHWSTANYAPFQELALWDGLVAMYEKVIYF